MQASQNAAPVDGSALLNELIKHVNGPEYTREARVWAMCSSQMRTVLWNLAGLNSWEHNSQFKEDWLKLPNELKGRIRAAIHEMAKFSKEADRCLKN